MEKMKDTIVKAAGRLSGCHCEEIEVAESFMDAASRFAHMKGTVLLMSGGDLDCARYHILGVHPWLAFSANGKALALQIDSDNFCLEADPFALLDFLIGHFQIEDSDIPAPLGAGLLGYLSYDLKDVIEKLPRTSVDSLALPHLLLYSHRVLMVHDKVEKKCRLFVPKRIFSGERPGGERSRLRVRNALEEFKAVLQGRKKESASFRGDGKSLRSNIEKPDYIRAVERIVEYIKSGDVYQVNMSQRFEMDFSGDSFALFARLYEKNPAPFFAYVNAGDHQIVCTSPERFLLLKENRVETRPIKGTRPRGKTPAEDDKNRQDLLQSGKDDAELSMIVDLLRNDLGKVCKAGSVRVAEHKRLEAYRNVYHLVSVVEGELDEGENASDLIRATFPGGSITGCPKIRSMEIIDELEPCRRHVYTGSIGYIGFHGTMDLNIAIRTATVVRDKVYFSVGGGIVYDSDPESEFEETLHKGQTLTSVLTESCRNEMAPPSPSQPMVWINGALRPARLATASVLDEGFQYGHGFFETIRVVQGVPRFLAEHLQRFHRAWQSLFPDPPPDITWADAIGQVVEANHLGRDVAAVKILATRGAGESPWENRTLLVAARPYVHRLKLKKNARGLRLKTYPHPRQTPLADHKTINYLYYLSAGRWAAENEADEALVLNPDGTVSETNTANILVFKDDRVVVPQSPHVLPGVFQAAVLDFLRRQGVGSVCEKMLPKDLYDADLVLATNSLMGAVAVIDLDGRAFSPHMDWAEKINKALL